MEEFEEVIGVYSFWMRAEHGDELFFDDWDECFGNADSLKTFDDDIIDLSGISGLRAWYDRFDKQALPVAEWPKGEYQAWVEEGWQYAYKVREVLPDHFDLNYSYEENGEKVSFPIPRKTRLPDVEPSTREAERLIREADEQIVGGILNTNEDGSLSFDREIGPLLKDYLRDFCAKCPDDRVLAKAHCSWNETAKELTVQWYLDYFKAYIIFSYQKAEWSILSKRYFSWHPGSPPLIHDFDCTEKSSKGKFSAVFLWWMRWYIVERGLE